jgi:O-antigen/teichoic acid export membrane protein
LNQQIIQIFGEEYLPASFAFALLIWDLPFVVFHGFSGFVTASIKLESAAARIHVFIGVGNVILNALLIPPFGLIGACFATVVTDFCGAVLFYLLMRRHLGGGLNLRRFLWIGFAATTMGIVVFLLREFNIVVVIGIGGLSYLVMAWTLPILSADEHAKILDLVGRVGRRLRLATTRS